MALLAVLEVALRTLFANGVVLAAGVAAFAGFLFLERRGRRDITLLLVLTVLIMDCILYPRYGTTAGVLQPTVLGRSLSMPALLTVVALAARATTADRWPRLRPAGVAWTAFLFWVGAAGVRGLGAEHPAATVFYQGLVVLHVGGVALLVATTPHQRLTDRTGLPLLGAVFAPVALLLALADAAQLSLVATVPLFGTIALGMLGGDAATALASLGVLCLGMAMSRPAGQRAGLIPGTLLLLAPLPAEQRAALLALLVAVLVLAFGLLLQGAPRALRLLPTEVVLGALLAAVLTAGTVSLATVRGVDTGLQDHIEHTFYRTAKQQSAQSRENQWTKGAALVERAPAQGNGLGVQYTYFESGPDELRETDITHNVFLDVAVRCGLLGVGLLLLALASTAGTAVSVLRRGAPPAARGLALGALAALGGLLAKGMVESIFEKHRLAVLLGAVVGLALTAHANRPAQAADEHEEQVPAELDPHTRRSVLAGVGPAAPPRGEQDPWT